LSQTSLEGKVGPIDSKVVDGVSGAISKVYQGSRAVSPSEASIAGAEPIGTGSITATVTHIAALGTAHIATATLRSVASKLLVSHVIHEEGLCGLKVGGRHKVTCFGDCQPRELRNLPVIPTIVLIVLIVIKVVNLPCLGPKIWVTLEEWNVLKPRFLGSGAIFHVKLSCIDENVHSSVQKVIKDHSVVIHLLWQIGSSHCSRATFVGRVIWGVQMDSIVKILLLETIVKEVRENLFNGFPVILKDSRVVLKHISRHGINVRHNSVARTCTCLSV